jgi:hypothetical protein
VTRQQIDVAEQRIQDLNTRVGELDTAATETQRRADQAVGVARDAETRLAQRIADRNKYRVLETRFIYFQSARSDINDAGVKELDEVARRFTPIPMPSWSSRASLIREAATDTTTSSLGNVSKRSSATLCGDTALTCARSDRSPWARSRWQRAKRSARKCSQTPVALSSVSSLLGHRGKTATLGPMK